MEKMDYASAIKYYKLALNIRLKAYDSSPNHPDIAISYNNLGNVYCTKKENEQAIKYYQDALKIYKKAYELSPDHPHIAGSYNNLGNAYRNKGEYEQAIKYYQQALEIYKKAYESNSDHPSIASIYYNLGTACGEQKKYAKAVFCLTEAKNLYSKIYESSINHPDLLKIYHNLAIAIQGNKQQIIRICSYHSDEGYFDFLLKYLFNNISLPSEQLNEVKEAYRLYNGIDCAHRKPSFEEFFALYPYEDNPDFFVEHLSGSDVDVSIEHV